MKFPCYTLEIPPKGEPLLMRYESDEELASHALGTTTNERLNGLRHDLGTVFVIATNDERESVRDYLKEVTASGVLRNRERASKALKLLPLIVLQE